MSWRTNKLILALRGVGRALGLNRWIASRLLGKGYETRYDDRFSAALRPGDCVWDVGANVGYYTRLFSARVGAAGLVFAFEPSPVNFARLALACSALGNVALQPCGLGKEDGRLRFEQGRDELGATSRIVEGDAGDGLVVDIRSGASLLDSSGIPPPNAIKIDVEGFEHEVLEGLGGHLADPALRLVGVEVHFGILKARGLPQVPRQIETLLSHHGFTVAWPDPSHLIALRSA